MDPIDWESDESVVLINPKIPSDQRTHINTLLTRAGLSSHFWLATSGSSATSNISPKWVALSKEAVLASAQSVNRYLHVTERDRWIQALPHFHVGGLGIWARAHLSSSQVCCYLEKWDSIKFHLCCLENRGTLTALVPTQLYDLVQNKLAAPSSLRATIIGGGGVSENLYFSAKKLGWNPLPSYGLSECASQVATALLSSLDKSSFPRFHFLPHIQDAAVNEEGCLKLRSSSLLTTYALIDENSCTLHDPKVDSWFSTDDLVSIDGNFLEVNGRKTDIVKISGENVNIEQLNRLLSDLAAVHSFKGDQVIVALPCDRLGCEVHLAEANTPKDQQEKLVEDFNKRVLPFERIKAVHHLEAVPRTALNKVKKEVLLRICRKA